jgi:DNA-binding response OmpR family regulator
VILVVDDEPTLQATLRFNLEREGHTVLTASDGDGALTLARERRPDLVILDLLLPRMGGFEVCRALRRDSDVPIIILTAKADEVDKVVGLELGADDYITKPFGMRELMARIAAQLRRSTHARRAGNDEVITSGDLRIDLGRWEVTRDGEVLPLKPKEFDLLLLLVQNKGQTLTRSQLLLRVWKYDDVVDTRTVDVHVGRLRKLIEEDPNDPVRIITIRGIGYRFVS